MNRAVWQVSGGSASRSHAEEFEGGFVRRFASEVATEDLFLLRTGIATTAAVGLVASDYMYVTAFEPVVYANLARLKKLAADLFARMQRS